MSGTVACTTGAFGSSPGGLMYAQATASIMDFNMIVAPLLWAGSSVPGSKLSAGCQRQFPNWSQIWACRQDVVPSAGILGGLIGATEGGTGPHIPMQVG